MIRARGRAISGALALSAAAAIWILVGAAPAGAYVCDFGINRPTPGARLETAAVRISGPFSTRQGTATRVIEVAFTAGPGAVPPKRITVPDGETYDVPVGPLSLNGSYTARVTATHEGTSLTSNCDEESGPDRRDTVRTAGVSFEVSVRARPPANVRATFDAGARSATITWDRSSDPDIAGYRITRKVGSGAPITIDVPPEPRSWTDARLPAEAGTLTYSVEAARNGPRPGTTSERSVAVAAAPLAIPARPSAPTSTRGPVGSGGAGRGGGSTATSQPFTLGRSVGDGDAPPATALPLPDLAQPGNPDGATALGPYTTIPEQGGSLVLNDDDDQAMAAGRSGENGGNGTRQLAYVAAGLLTTVVAAQALWLRRQALRPEPASGPSDRSPLEPLESVTPPASARPARRGASGPVVAAVPAPPDGPSDVDRAPAGGDRDVILRPTTDGPPAFVPAAGVKRPAGSRTAEASLAGPSAAGAAVAAASRRGNRRPRRSATRAAGAPVRAVPIVPVAPPPPPSPPAVHLEAGPVASPPEAALEAVGSPAPERPALVGAAPAARMVAPRGARGSGPTARQPVRVPRAAAPERQVARGAPAPKDSRAAPLPRPKRGPATPGPTRPRSRAVLIVRPRAPGAS